MQLDPRPRKRGVKNLTPEEKEALLARSQYKPRSGQLPDHHDERFWVECLLCGRDDITTTVQLLHGAEHDRKWRQGDGQPVPRDRCFHPKDPLPPRPPLVQRRHPGTFTDSDARALLAAIGPLADDADPELTRAVKRLAYACNIDLENDTA